MPGELIFTLVPIFIGSVFVFVLGSILFIAVNGAAQWSHNNKQPIRDVKARVVAKRTTTSRTGGGMHGDEFHHHGSTQTTHYAAFELDSGDRIEFRLRGSDFGVLLEGDHGVLSYQGTRFKGFSRPI